ncbi:MULTISPECIES: MBL fold metallo-hydrolase [unclassified Pseudoalteromonas]|uniref:MBL fold metallo-hydrolase n=1 Tax=unclassified Pseudoalteromonas TaxID=194690 RepID=UPI002098277B|nr:MBL fold metallo-hydrolase [Pseudoalteromonas sp. XMcav2-N]MCO7188595.1 MBL fold metallo-hydrolase [Pseudoalteromonas sp. XMcav2-N]
MTMLKALLITPLLVGSFVTLAATIQVQAVSQHLHILTEQDYGTNIGLFKSSDGVVLIDPMPGKTNLAQLYKTVNQIHHKPVTHILNTHNHEDHSGGNAYFMERGAQLVEGDVKLAGFTRVMVKSHTSVDNIFYHKPSNTIFVGDVFDTSWHPTFYAGGVQGFKDAIEIILQIGDEQSVIIPGHGAVSNKASLREFRANTLLWVETVRVFRKKGYSVEKIMAENESKKIVARFNVQGKVPFLPDTAYKRFVERTIQVIEQEENKGGE